MPPQTKKSLHSIDFISLLGKKWVLRVEDVETAFGSRQMDDETVQFHDPFLFPDMEKAVIRLQSAIESGEKIVVFGDYDVDGISGTATLVQALRFLGAQVSYRLPDRQQGYGLNTAWIENFKTLGVNVVITVDCGISNAKEIALAKEYGIDVVLTDHHTLPSILPEAAVALLHPRLPGSPYPFHDLAGSGMAFKLAVGLIQYIKGDAVAVEWRDRLVDLASLGTVADCVSLTGENRWIVRHGLDQMRKTEWKGLKVLLKSAGVEELLGYDADVIGFRIGPRINVAGRLESPYFALQVLLDENGSAERLAPKLEELNLLRQKKVEEAVEQAEAQLKARNLGPHAVLAVWDKDWPAGILGLIAARLCEKYHRPAIVLEDRGDVLVASCRSPQYFHMVEALKTGEIHLKTYGGHAAAAGFSIFKENLEPFLGVLQAYAQTILKEQDLTPQLHIESHLTLDQIDLGLVDRLGKMEPYGMGNPRPLFWLKDVDLSELQFVGREQRHIRVGFKSDRHNISAIAFKWGEHYSLLEETQRSGGKMDAVVEVGKSVWKGRERLEVKLVDAAVKDAVFASSLPSHHRNRA